MEGLFRAVFGANNSAIFWREPEKTWTICSDSQVEKQNTSLELSHR